MRCEVVAVGTELLLGQIVDTNSSWIGEQLALHGIDTHFQTRVGDNFDRIRQCLELALERSDSVIVCGGLGPTQDDITRDVIASVMGVDLVRDESIADRIRERFGGSGRPMPENNLRQADVPAGARIMEQMPGTAPGLVCPVGPDKVIYAVPGVPREMMEMVSGTVLPDLQLRAGEVATIRSRTIRTWGHSESRLAELLGDRIDELDRSGDATIAFLASGIEGLKVRITAKAADEEGARVILDAEEAEVRTVLGDTVFGLDDETMEHAVLALLESKDMTLGVAESVTGGLLASRLCSVPGASGTFRGGLVSYANDVKFELLDVPEGPVLSEETAAQMAAGVRKLLRCDVGLATTGAAGPAGAEGHPPGTVFVGLDVAGDVTTSRLQMSFNREMVRQYSVITLLNMLRLRLLS